MKKSSHLMKRMSERNIDIICISILHIFGSRERNRDGLYLSKESYYELSRNVMYLSNKAPTKLGGKNDNNI